MVHRFNLSEWALEHPTLVLYFMIVLAAIDGHGMKDVSALLGIPEGTVKSRLFEAKKQLQERLR